MTLQYMYSMITVNMTVTYREFKYVKPVHFRGVNFTDRDADGDALTGFRVWFFQGIQNRLRMDRV